MPESFGDALLKAPLKAGNRASAADADIVIKLRQRLRRRYLFKMMREHEESSGVCLREIKYEYTL